MISHDRWFLDRVATHILAYEGDSKWFWFEGNFESYEETAYYISSLTESAQVFAKIIRGHWKIENQLHWVKDVIFEEDKSEISDFQAASNWSILTTIGLNLFRGLGFLSITEGQRWLAERWEKLIVLST